MKRIRKKTFWKRLLIGLLFLLPFLLFFLNGSKTILSFLQSYFLIVLWKILPCYLLQVFNSPSIWNIGLFPLHNFYFHLFFYYSEALRNTVQEFYHIVKKKYGNLKQYKHNFSTVFFYAIINIWLLITILEYILFLLNWPDKRWSSWSS